MVFSSGWRIMAPSTLRPPVQRIFVEIWTAKLTLKHLLESVRKKFSTQWKVFQDVPIKGEIILLADCLVIYHVGVVISVTSPFFSKKELINRFQLFIRMPHPTVRFQILKTWETTLTHLHHQMMGTHRHFHRSYLWNYLCQTQIQQLCGE